MQTPRFFPAGGAKGGEPERGKESRGSAKVPVHEGRGTGGGANSERTPFVKEKHEGTKSGDFLSGNQQAKKREKKKGVRGFRQEIHDGSRPGNRIRERLLLRKVQRNRRADS